MLRLLLLLPGDSSTSLDYAHRHACHESTLAVEPRHEYSRWQDRLLRSLGMTCHEGPG